MTGDAAAPRCQRSNLHLKRIQLAAGHLPDVLVAVEASEEPIGNSQHSAAIFSIRSLYWLLCSQLNSRREPARMAALWQPAHAFSCWYRSRSRHSCSVRLRARTLLCSTCWLSTRTFRTLTPTLLCHHCCLLSVVATSSRITCLRRASKANHATFPWRWLCQQIAQRNL